MPGMILFFFRFFSAPAAAGNRADPLYAASGPRGGLPSAMGTASPAAIPITLAAAMATSAST